jgi:AraC-like DNA-binding protein
MTASVKGVTARATRHPSAPGKPWNLTVTDVRAFTGAFGRLGYDVARLLRAAGLRPADLEDPDTPVPLSACAAIMADAMQQRPLKNVALRLAAEMPIGTFPLLDYLILTCDDLGEGIHQMTRYFRLLGTPGTYEVHEEEDPIRVVVDTRGNAFGAELDVSLPLFHFRRETGGRLVVPYVSFAHRPDDVAEFERMLGCPVRAEASWSGFTIARESWRLPLLRRDPVLRGLLERRADEIAATLPPADDVGSQVRRVLRARVSRGNVRVQQVARDLATTSRTLQRRLAAAGLSYQDLLERARREAAERHLTECALSIAEVAYLLGYSEPSAFHRAFRRWFGVTPQSFRAALRSKPPQEP